MSLAIYMAKANRLLKVKSRDCGLWRREKRARFCLLLALVFATYGTGMSGWKSWRLKGKKNWQKESQKCHSNNEGEWFCNHLYFSTKGVLTSQLKGRELAYVNCHIRLGFFKVKVKSGGQKSYFIIRVQLVVHVLMHTFVLPIHVWSPKQLRPL